VLYNIIYLYNFKKLSLGNNNLKINKMELTFNNILQLINNLSLIEKEEIKFIIEKNIVEEKRNYIYKNYITAKKEFKKNKLIFSKDINKLKDLI
jgi:hypothetical protein